MDPRLLEYYEKELSHLREVGGEFAREYPKIAGRLALTGGEGAECPDPYVERLLEGFAFLAARVQLKIDAEFPAFTQHLLEVVYPHYLAPTPSIALVQMVPDHMKGNLDEGFVVPAKTVLRGTLAKGEQTACEYSTAHEVVLWPIEVIDAEYLVGSSVIANLGVSNVSGCKAGLRLRLRTTSPDLSFDSLPLDVLPLYLHGTGQLPLFLYEQMCANTLAVVMLSTKRPANWQEIISYGHLPGMGFKDSEALLPYTARSFGGFRLLHEYFAFFQRYRFVQLVNLQQGLARCPESEVDVVILFDRVCPPLENAVNAAQFVPFATPAVNLFPKRTDRIQLSRETSEFHVLVDRTRPTDFEVHSILEVTGYGASEDREQEFQPFYGLKTRGGGRSNTGYYALRRRKRVLSSRQRREGLRTSYIGHEAFLTLVDTNAAPYATDLQQLGIKVLCTNRDLPLLMPLGVGDSDFTMDIGAPVRSINCLAGPTKPRPSPADGEMAWRLINHLSINYLSLEDQAGHLGATAFRDLLALYADMTDSATFKQVEGLLSVKVRNVIRRIDAKGPIVFGRGLEINVTFDESAYVGTGLFLLGAVLDHFFARYASINTFTETVIHTTDRGEIMRWPVRKGQRHTL
jgi:type VI secretion system protein ImpG